MDSHSLRSAIRSSEANIQAAKIDWGAWAAILSKSELIGFIENSYRGNDWYSDPTLMPHLYKEYQELLEIVRGLSSDKRYALIAEEL